MVSGAPLGSKETVALPQRANVEPGDWPCGTSEEHRLTDTSDKNPEGVASEGSSNTVEVSKGEDPECTEDTAEGIPITSNPCLVDPECCSITDGSAKGIAVSNAEDNPGCWMLLALDIQDYILAHCCFAELFRIRSVCKSFRDLIKRTNFHQARGLLRPKEFYLSPLVFYASKGLWHILGFDYEKNVWRKLPPLEEPIPVPHVDLFKDFLVAGHWALLCANVGKPAESEKLYVCNPLTGMVKKLPPLKFSRHPVVLHITFPKKLDVAASYCVIAVGSSASGTEELSRKTEVYNSAKEIWESAGDVPGTDFSLNDHQTGVYCASEDLLLCVGFMVNGNKGILAFDVGKKEWRENWICPLYQAPVVEPPLTVQFSLAQLVECSGVIYLFSEQDAGSSVTHCIDRLDLISGGEFTWTRKVTQQRQGNRALLVYPEYTCVPVRENKLCIFNTIERTGIVYNMSDEPVNPDVYDIVPEPPAIEDGVMFHTLNPVGFAFEPSFGVPV